MGIRKNKNNLNSLNKGLHVLESKKGYELILALLAAKDAKLLKVFLLDLLTAGEIISIVNRYYAAEKLWDGVTRAYLNEMQGIHQVTLSHISKKLKRHNSGYSQIILEKRKSREEENDRWISEELSKLKNK